jgi:putative colanic acid biosynthesis glycosyltransferase WcaI
MSAEGAPVKILYVSQYFPPEMGAPSARVHELSREWVKRGHDVSVLTGFANHPIGQKVQKDKWRITRRERIDGIDVVRSYIWAAPNKAKVKRMLSYASFMASAAIIGAIRIRRPDVIIATSPQLLCALAGYLLSVRFRVPFVFEVRDLWPESVLAVEAMKENMIVRSLKLLAKFLYARAGSIVTVGGGYRDEIHDRYGIPLERMEVIPNGIDTELFVPGSRDNEVRREYGWGDRFIVLYLGTHGMAHALHVVLEAAEKLKDRTEILFAFVGEGAEKQKLMQLAEDKRLDNVQFIDYQPKGRVPLFYAACDVGLVPLRNTRLFQRVLPSKIFEFMGMAKPIFLSVDGEARTLVEEAQAGSYVPPENAQALCDEVLRAASNPEILKIMGMRGRSFVLRNFDRSDLADRYLNLLSNLAEKRVPANAQVPDSV